MSSSIPTPTSTSTSTTPSLTPSTTTTTSSATTPHSELSTPTQAHFPNPRALAAAPSYNAEPQPTTTGILDSAADDKRITGTLTGTGVTGATTQTGGAPAGAAGGIITSTADTPTQDHPASLHHHQQQQQHHHHHHHHHHHESQARGRRVYRTIPGETIGWTVTAAPALPDESEDLVEQDQDRVTHADLHAPRPRHHSTLHRPGSALYPNASPRLYAQHIMENRRPLTEENLLAPDPPSPSQNAKARSSASPSRPHLNALSPLQAFSPLQPVSQPLKESNSAATISSGTSERGGGLSRNSSLTRSLSRRQSLIAQASMWEASQDYFDENLNQPPLFSRLTLVKAPVKDNGLRRAKSSSALAPFAGQNAIIDNGPATAARGPRRSFAASSFASFSPMTKKDPLNPAAASAPSPDSLHRLTRLTGASSGGDAGMSYHHKMLSPQEVVDMARETMNPMVMPEGGLKGADIKRRKSAGASSRRSFGSIGSSAELSPEKPPLALEPVEYVQLDDETLLPYVERPQEVKELLDHPSNEKLVKLLKAAFPKDPLREHWIALGPEEWNWDELYRHLTTLSRIECPDYAWVFRARQAVRARSVALWEKLGVCLGCDGELLNAGGEDGLPSSWGGLSLGEEGEYDPSANQVYIEGLEAIDPEEQREMERQFREEFGEIVEDEDQQAAAGMTALLGTIGEGEEDSTPPSRSVGGPPDLSGMTTAQRAGYAPFHLTDPLLSPTAQTSPMMHFSSNPLPKSPVSPRRPSKPGQRQSRSRSFVGLQIMTSPSIPESPLLGMRSPSATTPTTPAASLPVYDRGPGEPLFPGSFSSLSVEPNLGRSASVGIAGGVKAAPMEFGRGSRRWSGIVKKPSGAGLSESAITFASESDAGFPVES